MFGGFGTGNILVACFVKFRERGIGIRERRRIGAGSFLLDGDGLAEAARGVEISAFRAIDRRKPILQIHNLRLIRFRSGRQQPQRFAIERSSFRILALIRIKAGEIGDWAGELWIV